MKNKKERGNSRETKRSSQSSSLFDIDEGTKRGIVIVGLAFLGIVGFLSLFNLAGLVGVYYQKALMYSLGWGAFIFPFSILLIVFVMYSRDRIYVRGANYFGAFLLIAAFLSLLHLFIVPEERALAAGEGRGGGYLGYFIVMGLVKVFGGPATWLITIFSIVVSLLLIFNTTLSGLAVPLQLILRPFYFLKEKMANAKNNKLDEESDDEEVDEEESKEQLAKDEAMAELLDDDNQKISFHKEAMAKAKAKEEPVVWKQSQVKIDVPLNILTAYAGKAVGGDTKNNAIIIQKTLNDFGIPVDMGEISVGPTVTQYTFKPAQGIKVSRITNLSNDLALALAAHPIRIEAPIPGRSLVGVEAPNQAKAIVGLREVLSSKEFKERKNNLMISLGKDVAGKPWLYDITKMPHLLVAGATNSGKSVCLNAIIVSLLYQNNPDDLRFIMVDPKRVELPVYNDIPHLLTPVITEVDKTINALRWCLNEMDRRFDILAKAKKRNIQSYNEECPDAKMPYLVFIIDELADLMVVAARDVEAAVIRLAQMARAVGIHLILATQRPSVDVITGLIKANMPARIAFAVASSVDSRTILDSLGAEKLLGSGDMLFVAPELSKPKRIQGAYVSDQEIKRLIRYIKDKSGGADYVSGITEKQKVKGMAGMGMGAEGGSDDELFDEAREIVIRDGRASTSLLQRRLGVGYGRAAKLIDSLEDAGIVGPANGAKPRELLISAEQYESLISSGPSGMPLHNRDEAVAPASYLGDDQITGVPPVFADEEEPDDEDEEEDVEEEEIFNKNIIDQEKIADPLPEDEVIDEDSEEEIIPEESAEDEVEEKNNKPAKKEKVEKNNTEKNSFDDDDGMYFSR